jgi:uncharacterized protein YndB with AHSA1/START domain
MTCDVHSFDAREGGAFRVSLTYTAPSATGKTRANIDTYHGRFVKLVPDELIVELIEFETMEPSLQGEITITTSLTDAGQGTNLVVVFGGLPRGVSAADNETGTRMSLAKLSALVEHG